MLSFVALCRHLSCRPSSLGDGDGDTTQHTIHLQPSFSSHAAPHAARACNFSRPAATAPRPPPSRNNAPLRKKHVHTLAIGKFNLSCFSFCASRVTQPAKMAKGAKSMMQPINLIFRFLNHKSRVCIWLVEQNQVRPPPPTPLHNHERRGCRQSC